MQGDLSMGIKKVDMLEAKSRLSELGELAWQGEEIVITEKGKPYLDLVAHKAVPRKRKPGRLKGKIRMTADFDETSNDLIATFEEQRCEHSKARRQNS